MMKTTIAALAVGLLALTGCTSEETPAPAPTVTETASQSIADMLMPPSATTTLEPIEGLLPPSTEWQPAPAPWQVDLPEVENLPPLPE